MRHEKACGVFSNVLDSGRTVGKPNRVRSELRIHQDWQAFGETWLYIHDGKR
jgi:hypothetical protein